jgi:prevent-host-death family protein
MAGSVRKSRLREVPPSEVKDDLSDLLREAAKGEIVITRHGKPAGVLIGFESEDDWFDYRLQTDPRFLRRAAKAPKSLRNGRRRAAGRPAMRRRRRKDRPLTLCDLSCQVRGLR